MANIRRRAAGERRRGVKRKDCQAVEPARRQYNRWAGVRTRAESKADGRSGAGTGVRVGKGKG